MKSLMLPFLWDTVYIGFIQNRKGCFANLCPTCITLHRSILKSSNHLLLQSFNLSKSSCISWLSNSCRSIFQLVSSSANILMFVLIHPGRLFTYIRDRNGLKTEPWGIPLMTSTQCEQLPLMVTLIFLSSKNAIIYCSQDVFTALYYSLFYTKLNTDFIALLSIRVNADIFNWNLLKTKV